MKGFKLSVIDTFVLLILTKSGLGFIFCVNSVSIDLQSLFIELLIFFKIGLVRLNTLFPFLLSTVLFFSSVFFSG